MANNSCRFKWTHCNTLSIYRAEPVAGNQVLYSGMAGAVQMDLSASGQGA